VFAHSQISLFKQSPFFSKRATPGKSEDQLKKRARDENSNEEESGVSGRLYNAIANDKTRLFHVVTTSGKITQFR